MQKKSKRKRFTNQAEEAAWWEANEEVVASTFERTMNEGYAGSCTLVVTGDSTVTKIRLGSRDSSKVRAQAAKRGQSFQAYLKMILHETLCKAEAERETAIREETAA
jgi:predicted DNA binding CopG/RHH family protein